MQVFCIGCVLLCDRNNLQKQQKLLQFSPIQQQAAHFHIKMHESIQMNLCQNNHQSEGKRNLNFNLTECFLHLKT